jgi:hypothetical protein
MIEICREIVMVCGTIIVLIITVGLVSSMVASIFE